MVCAPARRSPLKQQAGRAGLFKPARLGCVSVVEIRIPLLIGGPIVQIVFPGGRQLRALCIQQFGASTFSTRGRLVPEAQSRVIARLYRSGGHLLNVEHGLWRV
jgi:hypothetical protein